MPPVNASIISTEIKHQTMNITNFLVKLFGDKKSRDLKAYRPLVQAVLDVYPSIQALSDDDLRARVQEIRKEIAEKAVPLRQQIAEIKERIPQTEIQDRAPLFQQIDKLEKDVLEVLEKALDEYLKNREKLTGQNTTVE